MSTTSTSTSSSSQEAGDGAAAGPPAPPSSPPPPQLPDICITCGKPSHPSDPAPYGCDGAPGAPDEPSIGDFLKDAAGASSEERNAADLAAARAEYAFGIVEEGLLWALGDSPIACDCCQDNAGAVNAVERTGGRTEHICEDCMPRIKAWTARLYGSRRNG